MIRAITIVGGGLAGLGLGNALRRAEVPVTVIEAGHYPRHRVCGEFLAGIRPETLQALGIEDCFRDARDHRSSIWFRKGRPIRQYTLPKPAPGISRFTLDARMAAQFKAQGGELREGKRLRDDPREGTLFTCGRKAQREGYVGLKAHFGNLRTKADLELHLGQKAYAGVSLVENGDVNVCGLFKGIAKGHFPSPIERFHATLQQHGLAYLSERLREATAREESFCSVSGLRYATFPEKERPALGDRYCLIPPFTGNGMTLALESAEAFLPLAIDYAKGCISWEAFSREASQRLQQRFHSRIRSANLLHPFLLHPALQSILSLSTRAHVPPMSTLYRVTHA